MNSKNQSASATVDLPTLTEELHIFLIDPHQGGLVDADEHNIRCAFSGAALMDLAREHRIDTDMQTLTVLDHTPLGDAILDPLFAVIKAEDGSTGIRKDTCYWVNRFAAPEIANQIRRRTAGSLINRGIFSKGAGGEITLQSQMIQTRRYPGIPSPRGQDIILRVMNVIFSEDIPSPEEAMLISLVDACGILKHFLTKSELEEHEDRINVLRSLDLIGRSVRNAILTIRNPEPEDVQLRKAFLDRSGMTARALPPMAPGALPFVGHALRLRPYPTIPLAGLFRSLGPVFRIRDLASELTVLAGPEANQFCQKRGRSLFRSHKKYTPMFEGMDAQRIILSMDGEEHFTLRQAISSGFSTEHYFGRLPQIRDIVLREISEDRSFVATKLFSQHTAKSMALACTDYEMTSSEVEEMDFFVRRLIASSMLGVMPGFLARSRRMLRAKSSFFGTFAGMLGKRLNGGAEREGAAPDVVDRLLELHRSNPQFLPESELRVSCLGPVFAGMHTTASTGSFAMYLLLRHPEILERVRAEADALHSGEPTQEKFRKLDVTRRVVLETLRMYNPFLALYRTAINTFEFGGYTIPAGTRLFLPITVPHYCPEFFPEPERFDIDRFVPDRQEHRKPGCFMPYGFGTHRCLGSSIADLHLTFALTTILHHFDVELDPPSHELKIVIVGVPEPSKGYKLKFTRRR